MKVYLCFSTLMMDYSLRDVSKEKRIFQMMPWTWFKKLWTDFPVGPIWSLVGGTKILKSAWHGQKKKKRCGHYRNYTFFKNKVNVG